MCQTMGSKLAMHQRAGNVTFGLEQPHIHVPRRGIAKNPGDIAGVPCFECGLGGGDSRRKGHCPENPLDRCQ